MGPNTILKIKQIIIRRLKSKITKISSIQSLKNIIRPLAIIVYNTVQFNLECCKSSVLDMGPNTILKIKKYISNNILKVKLKIFPTYSPYEIWWTTCYHSPLHDTIQFGVLQTLCTGHVP